MARIVGRRSIREGRSAGERLTEIVVYVVIVAGVIWGGRWYFVEYLRSPKVALGRYLGLVKSGDAAAQYEMLSAASKSFFGDRKGFEEKWVPARGLAGRLARWEVDLPDVSKDRAEVSAVLFIRKPGQELYQAASEPYKDRYVLVKEKGDWKIALEASSLKSAESGGFRR